MGTSASLRFGRRLADGSVRYVLQPAHWTAVSIVSGLGVAGALALGLSVGGAVPVVPVILAAVIGVVLTQHAGFDLKLAKREIHVWHRVAGVPYGVRKLRRLLKPELRVATETFHIDDHERQARVGRVYFGATLNLVSHVPRDRLRELLQEVERLIDESTP
ncbi:MAG: hypothetical protein R3B13_27190 [Polyangiaceae bacterium]